MSTYIIFLVYCYWSYLQFLSTRNSSLARFFFFEGFFFRYHFNLFGFLWPPFSFQSHYCHHVNSSCYFLCWILATLFETIKVTVVDHSKFSIKYVCIVISTSHSPWIGSILVLIAVFLIDIEFVTNKKKSACPISCT